MSYGVRRSIRFVTALLLAISFSALGLSGAWPVAANNRSSSSEGMVLRMKLTPAQAEALKKAWRSHQRLSTRQAQGVIDSANGGTGVASILAKPAYAGFDESYGGCSHMWMWGYSSGD